MAQSKSIEAHCILAELVDERFDHPQRLLVGRPSPPDLIHPQSREVLVDGEHQAVQVELLHDGWVKPAMLALMVGTSVRQNEGGNYAVLEAPEQAPGQVD